MQTVEICLENYYNGEEEEKEDLHIYFFPSEVRLHVTTFQLPILSMVIWSCFTIVQVPSHIMEE